MCKYCTGDGDTIETKKFYTCKGEVCITNTTDSLIEFLTFDHETEFTEGIDMAVAINYCPMCGRKLVAESCEK